MNLKYLNLLLDKEITQKFFTYVIEFVDEIRENDEVDLQYGRKSLDAVNVKFI